MSNLHKAIIKGSIYRKLYGFYTLEWNEEPYMQTDTRFVREDTIWEGELDLPIMNSGDEIHIIDLDLTVRISGCLRTTDNKFIYSTYHTIETIEDEETEDSKKQALEYEEKYLKEKEEKRLIRLEEEQRPWYKKLFR